MLPAWLVLDRATGVLSIASGATDDAEVGVHTLTVTASDAASGIAHTVSLTIENVQERPFVRTQKRPHRADGVREPSRQLESLGVVRRPGWR